MSVAIKTPSTLESQSTRQAACIEAIRGRFQELHNPGEDYIDLIKEAMAAGWTMREARLAINTLLGVDLKDSDCHRPLG